MNLLIIGILALGIGPLLIHFLGDRREVTSTLDGFVLVVIGGLVFLEILPEGVAYGGWPALCAAGVGLLIPTFGERILHTDLRKTHKVVLVLGILAFTLHVFLDGVVLAGGDPHHDLHTQEEGAHAVARSQEALKLGVILHRVPVGIGIWWIMRGAFGIRMAVLLLMAVAGATVAGFFAAGSLYGSLHGRGTAILQSLLAGSLLHVVLHTHSHGEKSKPRDAHLSALGALAGIGVLALTPGHGGHLPESAHGSPLDTFLSLAITSAPALLIAYLIVGLSHTLMPTRWLEFLKAPSRLSQSLRGLAIGLPIPICSCGVVPLYRELILRGVPIAAALSFLVATPELELAAALLSFELLGAEVATARLLTAAGLAILVALIVSAVARPAKPESIAVRTEEEPAAIRALVGRGLRFGFGEAVDHTGPWILIGLGIAAIASPFLKPDWFAALPAGTEVPLMALIGLPLYVCASGSTPLAAILLIKGLSPGAALAFLLTGPATNVTTMGVIGRLHGRATAMTFAIVMVALATGFGYAVNALMPAPTVPPLKSFHEHGAAAWRIACAIALAVLFAASLWRQGARGFAGRITASPLRYDSHDEAAPAGGSCCH